MSTETHVSVARISTLALSIAAGLHAGDVPQSVCDMARQYLSARDAETRQTLARQLDLSGCDPVSVVRALRPAPATDVTPGYYPGEHFRTPELLKKHPDSLLFYVVPEGYRPNTPTALVVLMHGGGTGSPPTAPRTYMRVHDKTGRAYGDVFSKSGMIAVGPSAPVSKSSARWCLPESDDYIRDVVIESQARFNIDPDRVVLMGYSMGGFGAFHQAQRQPDRFAAVLAGAGSWSFAYWPVIHGTPLWIVHGANDAVPGKRPRFTDVEYARWADKLLTQQGIPHEYLEHAGGHGLEDAHAPMCQFVERMPAVRRDPYHPRVVCASPTGFSTGAKFPVSHNRWVTILETADGKLTYDCLRAKGPRQGWKMPIENWQGWELTHSRRAYPGALVDATNEGENRFSVTTKNVKRFALWLHPKMVDLSMPVRVTVNGEVAFDAKIKPSVTIALRSFERRRDWGLIYPAMVELSAPAAAK